MNYLGHNLINSSVTPEPEPSPEPEPDEHFKVIYRQNKAAIAARGPQNATATRLDSVTGSFKGDASFLGYGTYRILITGQYPWSAVDDGMNFRWFLLPPIKLPYGTAHYNPFDPLAPNNGIMSFRYEAEFTFYSPNSVDTLCSYNQRVEVVNSEIGFDIIGQSRDRSSNGSIMNIVPLPYSNYNLAFQLVSLTLQDIPDPSTTVAVCTSCTMEYLPE